MANQPTKYRKFVVGAASAALVASAVAPVASAAGFSDTKGNTHELSIDALVEAGIVSGYPDGTFKPNQKVTRGNVVKFLGKWLVAQGKEIPADYKTNLRFTDHSAKTDDELLQYAALVKDSGVFGGYEDGSLGAGKELTRENMAIVLVNALDAVNGTDLVALVKGENFKGEVTDKASAKAEARPYIDVFDFFDITTVAQFNPKGTATRGHFASFLYAAMNVDATPATAEIVSTKAVSAKTIEVTFNKAVDTDKAKFDVKRGTVKPSVKEVKFSEDKKTATIEFSTAMAAGDYTVEVTGLTETALTGKVTVTAEKLTSIKFLTDVAVISDNNITTRVEAYNQYGEDISSKLAGANVTVTASKGTSASVNKDGIVTVKGNAGTFAVGDKVVVTIVDSLGVSATQTLTVAQAAQVNTIELGEVKTDDAELAKKPFNLANMTDNASKYYIPVVIKDQYGNVLKASELAGVDILSSNKSIVNPDKFEDTKNGTIIKLKAQEGTPAAGTVVLTIVSSGTGKTANTTIEVKQNSKLDVVTLEAPATTLKLTKAAELPITISNTYGDEVALKDVNVVASGNTVTLDGDTKITAVNATFAVEQDYVNKKAILKITPTAKNMTLTVVTATGKVQILNLTADDAPVVAGISGLDANFVSLLGNDTDLSTDLKSAVKFVDQYGNAISQPAYDAADTEKALDFTIKAKDSSNAVTNFDKGVVTASTTAGSEVYEVILKDKDGNVLDQLDVTVSVVDQNKLTAFGIDNLDKFYTGATSPNHDQQVSVHGLLDGKKVKVKQDLIKDVTASNGLGNAINSKTGKFTSTFIETKNADVASTLTVLVANANNTYTLTKDVAYNSAAPKTSAIEITKGFVGVTADTVQVKWSDLNKALFTDGEKGAFEVFAEDQYGVARDTTAFTAVVTNNNTNGSISEKGIGSGFSATDAGKSLTLTVRVDGVVKTIRIVVGE